ncbi:MAG: cysteine synthase A [Peptoniphilaceae bacterium]
MNKNVMETIGATPLVKLNSVTDRDIYVKLEKSNPAGSIKDRPAYYMIKKAIENGDLKKGMRIVEPTSGNTGIALAMIGKVLGYPVTLVMPETMSEERKALMKAYGAELILTEGSKGIKASFDKAKELVESGEYYMPDQFSNPANPLAHEETTAKEILESGLKVGGFIAGIGTGGTVSGTGRALKKVNKEVKIWGLEPEESPIITKGVSGPHKIQGIGANFIPKNLDMSIVDKIIRIESDKAMNMARRLGKEEGLLVGISSGANVLGAIEMAKEVEGPIVTVLPDTGERYLSTPLFKYNED